MELNRILQMDCLDGLRQMEAESVDLVLTDPPYGISYQSAWRTDKEDRFDMVANDGQPFVWWLYDAFRVLKNGGALVCFCRWDVQEDFAKAIRWAGFNLKSQVIWDREAHSLGDLKASFAPQHDVVWFAVKGKFEFKNGRPKSVVRVMRVSADKMVHPTEKPVDLMKYFVEKLSQPGNVVLDPFMGGGATAVACQQTGRNYLGFEINEEYVKVAERRVTQKSLVEVPI